MTQHEPEALRFPFAEPPPFGEPVPVAPGILWLRLPLPYALDHVNLYLLEDGDGWALFDTGLGDERSRTLWSAVLAGALGGRPITRVVVSHCHPDHVGLAGWFDDRFAPPVHMTEAEYLTTRVYRQDTDDARSHAAIARFYRSCGLDDGAIAGLLGRGLRYLTQTTGLPPAFEPLVAGRTLRLGGRDWRILTGGGHSPDQAMLWCEADGLFLAADQVLERISPNVSVQPMQPGADPLSQYRDSLRELMETIPPDVLVLPSHRRPFHGLHQRARELDAHHEDRCARIAAACRSAPLTCAQIVPVIFHRALDSHQLGFAVGEAQAHLNHMMAKGMLAVEPGKDGVYAYRTR